jgi:SpoIID/LytB domain protein
VPLPARVHAQAVKARNGALAVLLALTALGVSAQSDPTDADLIAASGGRLVRLGSLPSGQAAAVPLEVYVARVLAGEAEPRAGDAAYQALAVAIRTYALANAGRHSREGFDVCDTTHCQVPRAATAVTRRAALATAGQVLTYNGEPAEVFYSASCGGHSESASVVWPGADYPYLLAVADDVHDGDEPWTLELTIDQVRQALARAGFEGRQLRDVRVEARSASGRATRIGLPGLQPDIIAGDQFRAAIGTVTLRSTAFTVEKRGSTLRFTGRGYGHGVGMCVIGAGRRAARGEDARSILARYYPGLELARLGSGAIAIPTTEVSASAPAARRLVIVRASRGSASAPADVERLAGQAHEQLSQALGTSVAPVIVRLHDSIDSFRQATGRPWWISAVVNGTTIDVAPVAVLAQRDGIEIAVRTAIAELLVAEPLAGRPAWTRVGAARYFARFGGSTDPAGVRRPGLAVQARQLRCPADAELNLAISATAQRDAEARAEACFARAYEKSKDWRAVR